MIVIGSAVFAYLYFGVLKKMGGWRPAHQDMPMADRPAQPQGPASESTPPSPSATRPTTINQGKVRRNTKPSQTSASKTTSSTSVPVNQRSEDNI